MYKILHLFRISVSTEDFIRLVQDHFTQDLHDFWIYGDRKIGNSSINVSQYRNVKYIRNIEDKLKSGEIYEYDKIIYHGVFEQDIIDFFFWNRRLLKKLDLFFWGGDKFLYGDNIQIYKKKSVVNNAHAVINIIPEERQFMKKNYAVRGRFLCAQYGPHTIVRQCDLVTKQPRDKKEYTAIQIGNSATSTNAHIGIMEKLVKFREEDIKIFLPLSYGDTGYADKVIKTGKNLFGEKFVGMTDFMKADEYYQFMNQMDIAIFGIKRQQALGNIFALLYLGKKVFLKEHTIVQHYVKHICHCNVWDINGIADMTYQEFISFGEDQVFNNMKNMGQIMQIESVVKSWDTIFRNT